MTPEEQDKLLGWYREGNRSALDKLVQGLEKELRKYIWSRVFSSKNKVQVTEVDDIVQDTWIRFIKYQDKCNESVAGFLMRGCAYYAVLDFFTKRAKIASHETTTEAEGVNTDEHLDHIIEDWDDVEASVNWHEPDPEEAYIKKEAQDIAIEVGLGHLGLMEREVYTAHHAYGYTYKEIADDLDLTIAEISVMMDNASKKIKRRVG